MLVKADRAAFKFWCKGLIRCSKLEVDVCDDGSVLKLVESLVDAGFLSFKDMYLLKEFLNGIGRVDVLRELERVEM